MSRYEEDMIQALKEGNEVLLEVGDIMPRSLYPVLKLSRNKGTAANLMPLVILNSQVVKVHNDFKIYITSFAKAPDYGSELSIICNFINFSVT